MDQLGVDEKEVTPFASFIDDLNADPFDLVELIMSLEEEFSDINAGVEIPDEDAKVMKTVQDVVEYIRDQGIKDQ